MPKLSDTMEEETILRWYKHEGEHVEAGEVLAEVETDKADMEVEASASGTLAGIRVPEGASAAVGAVIAVLDGTENAAQGDRRPVQLSEEIAQTRAGEPVGSAARRITDKSLVSAQRPPRSTRNPGLSSYVSAAPGPAAPPA
jgi:pyruvate dehydrogenase E2 component (dihydrolipoamide acetyltransferase)